MKLIRLTPWLLMLALAGCSQEANVPKPATVRKVPKLQSTDEPTLMPPPPGSHIIFQPMPQEVPPELVPLQNTLDDFVKANNRLPNNVQELLEKSANTNPPALSPGKIYYIDHATKQVRIGGGP